MGLKFPDNKLTTEITVLHSRVISVHKAFCVTEVTVVPPRIQTLVLLQDSSCSLQIISSRPELFEKYLCTVTNDVADVQLTRLFNFQVVNLSDRIVSIHKRVRIGIAAPAPSTSAVLEVLENYPRSEDPITNTVKESLEVYTLSTPAGTLRTQEERAFIHLRTKWDQKPDIL